jgi:hypothetical protein
VDLVKRIPETDNPVVLRTDFSDDAAWRLICAAIEKPDADFGFRAHVDFVSDPAYDEITMEQILSLIPKDSDHALIFVVDRLALSHPDHPILVVNLESEPGRTFRVVPSEMWAVENNLSLANMDFDEFAGAVRPDGVFRGFPAD